MAWIVFVSNGKSYSDYSAWPCCTAETEDEALKAMEAERQYIRDLLSVYGEGDGSLDPDLFDWDAHNLPKPPHPWPADEIKNLEYTTVDVYGPYIVFVPSV